MTIQESMPRHGAQWVMKGEGTRPIWTRPIYELVERFEQALKEPVDDPPEQTIIRVHTGDAILLKDLLDFHMGVTEPNAQGKIGLGCHSIACLNLILNTSLYTLRQVDKEELKKLFYVPGGRPYETLEKILKDTRLTELAPQLFPFPEPLVMRPNELYWCTVDDTFDIHAFFEEFIRVSSYSGGGILSFIRKDKPNHALAFVKRAGTCVFLDDSPDEEKEALVTSPTRARKQRFEYNEVDLNSHGRVCRICLYY